MRTQFFLNFFANNLYFLLKCIFFSFDMLRTSGKRSLHGELDESIRTNGLEDQDSKIMRIDYLNRKNVVLTSIFIMICFSSWHIHALKNNQELFLQAVNQQQEKNYGHAINLYEQINQPGRAALYNTALSYYALNKFPQALAYLQKAQHNAPYREYMLITDHLNIINKQLGKPIVSFWYSILAAMVSGISLLFLQLLFLALWYGAWWHYW
jgi:tetratricopeptide (TPR) repeat protein